MKMLRFFSKAQPLAYQLMRIVVGVLFAFHGAQKVLGLFGGQRVALASQFGAAGIIELVGGLLVAAGVAVTPVAFICSGEMAVAYFQAHFPRGMVPIQNQGELSVLYCFAFLYISTRGAR
jgi:putative oxidoreductase